ncbi:MAG TPA: AAA family ATPase, partial [Dyella sp.]|uniref:AAA family ATPase n=1 Tax=Dyella sp. TaxID=1869338 RepID=UPI002D780413
MSARDAITALQTQMETSIIGQNELIRQMIVGLLANGHLLLESLPGLAKTRAVKSMAKNLDAQMRRIQFTPDLLPSDITGTEVLHQQDGQNVFQFQPGPIFGNVILADEINRAPAKVQAALLEAMEERQITVAGATHKVPDLFIVMATQNPIEQEGTYPLPEAQQDRFMFTISVGYPNEEDEFRIIESTTSAAKPQVERVVSGEELLRMQDLVRRVPAAAYIIRYALKLSRLTRPHAQHGEAPDPNVPDFVKKYVTWGA